MTPGGEGRGKWECGALCDDEDLHTCPPLAWGVQVQGASDDRRAAVTRASESRWHSSARQRWPKPFAPLGAPWAAGDRWAKARQHARRLVSPKAVRSCGLSLAEPPSEPVLARTLLRGWLSPLLPTFSELTPSPSIRQQWPP